MRFEFKLRIGPLAIEASDWDNFVPFQITVWRYRPDGGGFSVCNIRWNKFKWHGWVEKNPIRFTCNPRIVDAYRDVATGKIVLKDDNWQDVIDG